MRSVYWSATLSVPPKPVEISAEQMRAGLAGLAEIAVRVGNAVRQIVEFGAGRATAGRSVTLEVAVEFVVVVDVVVHDQAAGGRIDGDAFDARDRREGVRCLLQKLEVAFARGIQLRDQAARRGFGVTLDRYATLAQPLVQTIEEDIAPGLADIEKSDGPSFEGRRPWRLLSRAYLMLARGVEQGGGAHGPNHTAVAGSAAVTQATVERASTVCSNLS